MGTAMAFGEEMEVTLWTLGPVDSVEAEILVGGETESHPVAHVGLNPLDEDTWSLFLADGAYVPGESSALGLFDDVFDVAVKLRAYHDGDIVACGWAGTVMGDPTDYFDFSDCPEVW